LGHIYVKAKIFNVFDYVQYLEGKLRYESVRGVEVEALVDTGATFPALPEDIIEKLGLIRLGEHVAETAEGVKRIELYWPVMILIEDRFAETPVIKRPRGTTPLIGVIALEQMGFKVDPTTGKLVKGLPLML
jgi:aspartyl protease family protein